MLVGSAPLQVFHLQYCCSYVYGSVVTKGFDSTQMNPCSTLSVCYLKSERSSLFNTTSVSLLQVYESKCDISLCRCQMSWWINRIYWREETWGSFRSRLGERMRRLCAPNNSSKQIHFTSPIQNTDWNTFLQNEPTHLMTTHSTVVK